VRIPRVAQAVAQVEGQVPEEEEEKKRSVEESQV